MTWNRFFVPTLRRGRAEAHEVLVGAAQGAPSSRGN